MKLFRMLFLAAFFFSILSIPTRAAAQTSPSDCGATYTVARGDWLSTIAARCGVPLADLLAANPEITNPERIFAGQVIAIPGGAAPEPQVQVLEDRARPGGLVTVVLQGFPPNMEVELGLGRLGENLVSAGVHRTDGRGGLQVRLELPGNLAEGESWVAGAVALDGQRSAGVSQAVRITNEEQVYIVQSGDRLSTIARNHDASLASLLDVNPEINSPHIIYTGQRLVIPPPGHEPSEEALDRARGFAAPAPGSASYDAAEDERWIDVDVTRQAVYAYEGDQVVRSFVASTGKASTPTVLGQYRIYIKLEATDMRGPGYFYRDVPYTMYFYRGYGLHGTFWHNNFGTPMSAGCVNLSIEDAKWLFDFASVGTLVNVH